VTRYDRSEVRMQSGFRFLQGMFARGVLSTLLTVFLLAAITLSLQCQVAADQLTSTDQWKPERVPFSFKYAGQDSAKFLTKWEIKHEALPGKDSGTQQYSYADPITHLRVIAEVRRYSDFPNVVDWVLRFRNEGSSNTPIIENILPLDWTIPASPGKCLIRHA
jgi:hypothetical protein